VISIKKNALTDIAVFIVPILFICVILKYILLLLLPFLIGFFIAYILKNVAKKINATLHINYKMACFFCLVIFYTIFIWIFVLAINIIKNHVLLFVYNIDIDNIINGIVNLISSVEDMFNITINNADISNFLKDVFQDIITRIVSVVNKVPSLVASIFLILISSIFFTFDYYKIQKFLIKNIQRRYIRIFMTVKSVLIKNFKIMLKSQMILMMVTFIFLNICFIFIGQKDFLIISLTISVLDFFPLIGTGVYFVPWILIESTTDHNYSMQLLAIYFLTNILRNFIEPYVLSSQVKIHPLCTIFTLYVSVKCLGILGILLSPIITITVVDIIRNYKRILSYLKQY